MYNSGKLVLNSVVMERLTVYLGKENILLAIGKKSKKIEDMVLEDKYKIIEDGDKRKESMRKLKKQNVTTVDQNAIDHSDIY